MISVGGGSIRPSFCLINLLLYECASADVSDMLTSLPSAEVTTTIKHILAMAISETGKFVSYSLTVKHIYVMKFCHDNIKIRNTNPKKH